MQTGKELSSLFNEASHSDLEKRAKILSGLGLTYNQAKVYYGILLLGTTPIEPISKIANVRREDVYRMLPALSDIGIVERIPSNPIRVRALSEKETLSILLKIKTNETSREITQMTREADNFLRHFRPIEAIDAGYQRTDRFIILNSKNTIELRLLELIKNTSNELIIMGLEDFFHGHSPILDILVHNDVSKFKIRMISGEEFQKSFDIIKKQISTGFTDPMIKFSKKVTGAYVISDGKEVIIDVSGSNSHEEEYLWSSNTKFISLLKDDFERFWDELYWFPEKSDVSDKNRLVSANAKRPWKVHN